MTVRDAEGTAPSTLRREAEQRLATASGSTAPLPAGVRQPGEAERLLHELEVHQVELEMQNEELRRARGELEALVEKYCDLYDFAPVGYVTLDVAGSIVEANLAAATFLGIERARLAGRRLVDAVADDSRGAFNDFLGILASTSGPATVEVSLLQGPAGKRRLQLQGVATEPASGREVELRIAATDITARVQAEREREALRTQLQAAEKLESVGRLAGGVAHDFNNMLGVILGFAERALGRLGEDEPLRSDLTHITTAAERAAALTRKLLAFASKQPIRPQRLDLNAAVDHSLELLRRVVGSEIAVVWTPQSHLWPVFMDPGQVDQVLTALAVNARDAIPGVGRFTLATKNLTLTEARPGGPGAGQYVVLTVGDSGVGMDEVTRRNLFEPFFTSREFGQAKGLGLAVVYGILRQNGGSIEVESTPGRGTTFSILLPRLATAVAKPAIAQARYGPQTVLLVEDEPTVLEVLAEMIERLGFRVLSAGSPGEALALAEQYAGNLDLLVTDVVMPEMNGRELAERLTARRPGLRVLFISGYSAGMVGDRGVELGFLQKPFSRLELEASIHEVLSTES